MAERLSGLLRANGWRVVNDWILAVVCFVDAEAGTDPFAVANRVVAEGVAWIAPARFEGCAVLRACITSHFTTVSHLEALVEALGRARCAEIEKKAAL